MERNTALWALTLFFGGLVLSGALRRLTEDEPIAVVIGVQLAALALVVVGILLVVRRLR